MIKDFELENELEGKKARLGRDERRDYKKRWKRVNKDNEKKGKEQEQIK